MSTDQQLGFWIKGNGAPESRRGALCFAEDTDVVQARQGAKRIAVVVSGVEWSADPPRQPFARQAAPGKASAPCGEKAAGKEARSPKKVTAGRRGGHAKRVARYERAPRPW